MTLIIKWSMIFRANELENISSSVVRMPNDLHFMINAELLSLDKHLNFRNSM